MKLHRYAVLTSIALVAAPAVSWAGATTCLTGTDPTVAGDLVQVATVRTSIDSACVCANFDGSPGKAHGDYVKCVKGVIGAKVTAGELRKQCKGTVTKYYSTSTCGFPASQARQPCIKVSKGKVTCAIKPAAKCVQPQAPCAGFSTCIDAADSNQDGLVGAGDSGACVNINKTCPCEGFVDTPSNLQTTAVWNDSFVALFCYTGETSPLNPVLDVVQGMVVASCPSSLGSGDIASRLVVSLSHGQWVCFADLLVLTGTGCAFSNTSPRTISQVEASTCINSMKEIAALRGVECPF